MQLYCKIIKGKAHGPYRLPALDKKPIEELKEMGVLPAICEKPQTFDDATEKWNENEYEITDDAVIVKMTKSPKTAAEKKQIRDQRAADRQQGFEDKDAMVRSAARMLIRGELNEEQEGMLRKAVKGKLKEEELNV